MSFCASLKEVLAEEGISQRGLAKLSGFHQSQISRFCRDSVPNNPADFSRITRGLKEANQSRLFLEYMKGKIPEGFAESVAFPKEVAG